MILFLFIRRKLFTIFTRLERTFFWSSKIQRGLFNDLVDRYSVDKIISQSETSSFHTQKIVNNFHTLGTTFLFGRQSAKCKAHVELTMSQELEIESRARRNERTPIGGKNFSTRTSKHARLRARRGSRLKSPTLHGRPATRVEQSRYVKKGHLDLAGGSRGAGTRPPLTIFAQGSGETRRDENRVAREAERERESKRVWERERGEGTRGRHGANK